MAVNFQKGDYIRVDNFYDKHKSVIGIYDSENIDMDIYWIDLKQMDKALGHLVLTGIKRKNCYKITKKEWFKFKLQGKGIGLYAN